MRQILILRGGALGDFLVTLPALALLRQRWPDAHIELIGNATAASIAVNRGVLDAVHSQHEARWSALFDPDPLPGTLAAWLREFDLILNFWPDPDDTLRRHFPLHAQQTFLSAAAMPTRAPAAAHYCEPLRALGLETPHYFCRIDRKRVSLNPPPEEHRDSTAIRPANSAPSPIAIHPGSGSPRKNWPAERWLEVIRRVDAPILLIVGEAERQWSKTLALNPADKSAPVLPSRVRILSQPSLESLISELSACRLFLGHDSGISHLAAACGISSILLFGPTDPAIWAPPAAHVRIIQQGADLAAISVDEVHKALR